MNAMRGIAGTILDMRFEQQYPKWTPKQEGRAGEGRELTDAEFSERWKHPQEITTTLGEKVKLYDMRPEHEKTSVPVLCVSGFSGNAELWKKNMREFYALGRRSIILDGSHGVEYDEEEVGKLDARARGPEKRKVAAMFTALDGAHVEKADAVGHSKGCIDVVLAAYAYPERFRNIVLIEPAGMNLLETLGDVIVRNVTEDGPSIAEAHDAFKRGETDWKIHPDDKLEVNLLGELLSGRSVSELRSVANIRVVDLLRAVHEKGINISIVQSEEDKMFHGDVLFGRPLTHEEDMRWRTQMHREIPREAEEILAAVEETGEKNMLDERGNTVMDTVGALERQKRAGEEDLSNIVDDVIRVPGIHVRFYDQPVEYTKLIDGALTELAAKKGEQ